MPKFYNISYISPFGKHSFNSDSNYYIVIISYLPPTQTLTVIKVNDVNNVNEKNRACVINKSCEISSTYFKVNLYEENLITKRMNLLLTNTFSTKNFDQWQTERVMLHRRINSFLYSPNTKNINKIKNENISSFMLEEFVNYEYYEPNNFCLLFSSISHKPKYDALKPFIINFKKEQSLNNLSMRMVYSRYSKIAFLETNMFKDHDKIYLDNNIYDCRGKINLFLILKNNNNKFNQNLLDSRSLFRYTKMNEINFLKTREIKKNMRTFTIVESGKKETILCPSDNRLMGFYLNKKENLMNLFGKIYDTVRFVKNTTNVNMSIIKSGFLSRMSYNDNKIIYMPLNGNLINVNNYLTKNLNVTTFNLVNEYHISHCQNERDYWSVFNGNYMTKMSRHYPELMKMQDVNEMSTLKFSILIIRKLHNEDNEDNLFISNSRIINYLEKNKGNICNEKYVWINKGEELCKLVDDDCYLLFLTNQITEFDPDIYEHMVLESKLECYLKCKDTVGKI